MKNGVELTERKKQEDTVCSMCSSYREMYRKSKRKIQQLNNTLRDVNSLSESTSRFILSASSAVFE